MAGARAAGRVCPSRPRSCRSHNKPRLFHRPAHRLRRLRIAGLLRERPCLACQLGPGLRLHASARQEHHVAAVVLGLAFAWLRDELRRVCIPRLAHRLAVEHRALAAVHTAALTSVRASLTVLLVAAIAQVAWVMVTVHSEVLLEEIIHLVGAMPERASVMIVLVAAEALFTVRLADALEVRTAIRELVEADTSVHEGLEILVGHRACEGGAKDRRNENLHRASGLREDSQGNRG
mmetsp:Transcript_79044/g.155063  ORF Transcript_79044/g.155063 Transcript_79044/m.155063 type:complete len:235 (+) Transcript_79044:231-935(+)